MSNYLFAMGKEDSVRALLSGLSVDGDSPEVTLEQQANGWWALVVERRAQHVASSIQQTENGQSLFFRGYCIDHEGESMVLGAPGFSAWCDRDLTRTPLDLEGTFVLAAWDEERLLLQNDLFSLFPVCWFSTNEVVVASDSLYLLSRMRRALGLPCKLNKRVMYSRAWTHGLACAVMSNETIVKGIQILSPGKHIEVNFNRPKPMAKLVHIPIKQIFLQEFSSYSSALVDSTRKFHSSIMSLLHFEDVHINFGLSGGLDSRIILAILLKNPELMNKVSITTNTHASRRGDFEVVSELAEKYGFRFNNMKEELSEYRKHSTTKSVSEKNGFGFWVLSCMGLFDMMYFHDSYWKNPNVLDMGGHGAEAVKGTFSSMRFEVLLHRKTMNRKFRFTRAYWRDRRMVKNSQRRWNAIRQEVSDGLLSSGIDLDESGALQWHYLCYKSPIQNGRFIDRSCIALRPFLQRNLYALSRFEHNPFLTSGEGQATLLHDMLILIDPELAAHPFENSKNDVDSDYIEERITALNQEISFDDIKPYAIHGSVTDIANGPANAFMSMVQNYDIGDEDRRSAILSKLEVCWQKIAGTGLGEIYESAYELARERLEDQDCYLANAGTPAAKILALSMVDC